MRRAFLKVFGNYLVSLVLYGSYARGDARPDSDIDLIVVVEDDLSDRLRVHKLIDEVEDLLMRELRDYFRSRGLTPILSPYILTRSQARMFRPLYIDVVFDAIILYDKDGFMSKVFKAVREKLKRLGAVRRRIGRKWVVVLKPHSYRFGEVIDFGGELVSE